MAKTRTLASKRMCEKLVIGTAELIADFYSGWPEEHRPTFVTAIQRNVRRLRQARKGKKVYV